MTDVGKKAGLSSLEQVSTTVQLKQWGFDMTSLWDGGGLVVEHQTLNQEALGLTSTWGTV